MPHFVTAAAGEPHVTSTDTAHYNAGTLGPGCYVLPLRDRMACTMVDSNTLRILAGDAVVCGRQWAIEGDYEELNIDNGVPGYNRIDLVVCRIEIGENETIELKVYKGEETTGTPVVPGHVTGDLNDGDNVCEMPICSVRINGINPQAPEMLAKESIDIMALLQELRDYKSQCPYAVGDLYITKKAGNPKDKWPGTTWTQITGCFLRAANDTKTGGSDTVSLAVANIPPHGHAFSGSTSSAGAHSHYIDVVNNSETVQSAGQNFIRTDASASSKLYLLNWGSGAGYWLKAQTGGAHGHTFSGTTASVGSGAAFSVMPAYQDVYAWERTA